MVITMDMITDTDTDTAMAMAMAMDTMANQVMVLLERNLKRPTKIRLILCPTVSEWCVLSICVTCLSLYANKV